MLENVVRFAETYRVRGQILETTKQQEQRSEKSKSETCKINIDLGNAGRNGLRKFIRGRHRPDEQA